MDKWESTNCSPATKEWKYPARIKDLDNGRRLDRWETADRPNYAIANMDSVLEIAIEGLERLLIDHHIDAETITVTRNVSLCESELKSEVDVDAEFVDSSQTSIRA
ncbi:hypothetical protein [Haloarcula sp. H-GB5]